MTVFCSDHGGGFWGLFSAMPEYRARLRESVVAAATKGFGGQVRFCAQLRDAVPFRRPAPAGPVNTPASSNDVWLPRGPARSVA